MVDRTRAQESQRGLAFCGRGFIMAYYSAIGVISVLALGFNLLLLVGLLSIMQATLTLPGMAALALTVGMAIDANVLINERIRDELRNGASPQLAIHAGFERALGTIMDSNITTLIAGIALFALGSGPVKGFAVVLCLGILTSVFTATFVTRGMVNLVYGSRRKLDHVPIGKIWIPKKAQGSGQTTAARKMLENQPEYPEPKKGSDVPSASMAVDVQSMDAEPSAETGENAAIKVKGKHKTSNKQPK